MRRVTDEDVVKRLHGRSIELVFYAGTTAGLSTFRCTVCGGVWHASVNNVTHSKNPTGCKHCAPNARVFEDDVRMHLKSLQIELVRYCGTTNGHSDYRCDVCGHEWSVGYNHIQSGTGCPECADTRRGDALRFDEHQAQERIMGKPFTMTRYGGKVASISDFLCSECGHKWSTSINNITNGTGCPKCAGRMLVTEDEAVLKIAGRNITIIQYGGGAGSRSLFRCNVEGCNHEWSTTLAAIVSGQGCRKCAGSVPVTVDEAVSRIAGRPLRLVSYAGTATGKSTFQCLDPDCGYEWQAIATNVFKGRGCPKCGGRLALTVEEVNARLKGRPIALLEYAGSVQGKSKFKCMNDGCGNEWRASLNNVHDAQQGCPKCAKCGFKAHEPAHVYVYKISVGGTDYVGFGITNDLKTRNCRHKTVFRKAGAVGQLLFSYKTSGKTALDVEKTLKQNFPIVDTGITGFRTEAFLYDEVKLASMCAMMDSVLGDII